MYRLQCLCDGLPGKDTGRCAPLSGDSFRPRRMHLLRRMPGSLHPRCLEKDERAAALEYPGKNRDTSRGKRRVRQLHRLPGNRLPQLRRCMRRDSHPLQPARGWTRLSGDIKRPLHRVRCMRIGLPRRRCLDDQQRRERRRLSKNYFLTLPTKVLPTSGGASTCATWHWVQLWRAAEPSASF